MKKGMVVSLLVLAAFAIYPRAQKMTNSSHEEWLREKYKEATSIEAGMNRADLLNLFIEDGGLQTIPATKYVLKDCRMIKIDVDFDTKYGQAHRKVPDKDLRITKVSKPYLEYMYVD